jgi:MutL protein
VSGAIGTQQRPVGALATPSTRSLLVIDCGSVYTKVALLGIVDGRYRLLARSQMPTTSAPPHADCMQGILAGVADVERICAHPLLRNSRVLTPEQDTGEGVDAIAVTISAGGPLRLLTAGPGREALAALVHRAIGGLFVALEPLPVDVFLREGEVASAEWTRQVARVSALHPHAVLMIGPSLEGRSDVEDTGRQVATWIDALRLHKADVAASADFPVVFAGTVADATIVRSTLAGHAVLQAVDPLSPSTLAPLNQAVAGLYETAVLRAVPGFEGIRSLSRVPPSAVATSLAGIVRYLSQHYQMNVVGVDVGASSTMLAGATAEGGFLPASHPDAGVGPGLGAILRAAGAANVLRWVTEPLEEAELREYVIKRMLRPRLLPATSRELEIEQAFAREAILLALRMPGSALAGLHPLDVVLGTGGVLANAPHPAQVALLLLDALQPRGITSLLLDSAQLAGMLGGIAGIDAAAAAQVTESDVVATQLASAVSTFGSAPPGKPAVRVTLELSDSSRQVTDVVQGSLVRIPVPPGERALLSLLPAPTVDVGLGPGQQARASDPLDGGLLGLIVDARGRPLSLPQNAAERVARQQEWRRAMGIAV